MKDLLVERFANSRPSVVARELEKFDIEAVQEFLSTQDAQTTTRIVSRLSSNSIYSLLSRLPASDIATMLCDGVPVDTIVLLAHVPAAGYEAIV